MLDVIVAGLRAGEVIRLPLRELTAAAVAGRPLSSHGFGPAEALRLAQSLGRALPEGVFLGIEGVRLTPGTGLDPAVRDGIEALTDAAEQAIRELSERTDREVEACTNPE